MASIGTFEPSRDGGWSGQVFLLGQQVKLKLAPNDNPASQRAPAYRVFAGAAELGALWLHQPKEGNGKEYLSGEMDFPGLPEPISFAVFFGEEGTSARAVWNRKRQEDQAPAH